MKYLHKKPWYGKLFGGIILVALVGGDIFANLRGSKYVSEQSVVPVVDQRPDLDFDQKIYEWESQRDSILARYTTNGKLLFGPYPLSRHRKPTYLQDKGRIEHLDKQIQQWQALHTQAVKISFSDHESAKLDHASEIDSRHEVHQMVIQFLYVMIFIISLFCAGYRLAVRRYVARQMEEEVW